MENDDRTNEKVLSWAKLGFAALVQCVVVVSYVVYFASDFRSLVRDVSKINDDVKQINGTIRDYNLNTYKIQQLEQNLGEVKKQCASCSR